jgi:uncharacterized protein
MTDTDTSELHLLEIPSLAGITYSIANPSRYLPLILAPVCIQNYVLLLLYSMLKSGNLCLQQNCFVGELTCATKIIEWFPENSFAHKYRQGPDEKFIMLINLHKISPLPKEAVEFLEELSRQDSVEKLIIFGSRACGDYEKYSDIDLAVVASSFTGDDWVMLRAKANHHVRVVFRISIVDFLSNPDRLQQRIYNDGEIIYEKP